MVLNTEDGQFFMAQALHRAIVKIDMGNLKPVFKTIRVNGIAVILGSDVDLTGGEVADGVVSPTVPELQLEASTAKGSGNKLIAQADAHNRLFTDELFNCIHDVVQ